MTRKNDLYSYWLLIILCIITGCGRHATSSNQSNKLHWEKIALQSGFKKVLVKSSPFLFTTFQNIQKPYQSVTIYIEGDGRAWITRHKRSPDPTPLNPIALKLAIRDPSQNQVYLARPCQYTPLHFNETCEAKYWASHRFSETVIKAMNEAITKIKAETKATSLHLVGFSGGASVATLIAARRADIASIRTVAGDLDHELLSQYHHTTPLSDSLNPKDFVHKIAHIPQIHFIGEKDHVVPPHIAKSFVQKVNEAKLHCAQHFMVKEATHHKAWEKSWPQLLQFPFHCQP